MRRLPGYVVGSIVATGFGTAFVIANSGDLDAPWPLILRARGRARRCARSRIASVQLATLTISRPVLRLT
jgi:hypothetical protein